MLRIKTPIFVTAVACFALSAAAPVLAQNAASKPMGSGGMSSPAPMSGGGMSSNAMGTDMANMSCKDMMTKADKSMTMMSAGTNKNMAMTEVNMAMKSMNAKNETDCKMHMNKAMIHMDHK